MNEKVLKPTMPRGLDGDPKHDNSVSLDSIAYNLYVIAVAQQEQNKLIRDLVETIASRP
ncbi:MAG: hypothetical protein GKS03_08415 [Alphaproteobacteria bacterium]|nr:hypothetical protein [Alphaproteobacteria bacterium]